MEGLEKLITTNLEQRTVVVLRYTDTPVQADNSNHQLLKYLRKIRRSGAKFEYRAYIHSDGEPARIVESKNWRKE